MPGFSSIIGQESPKGILTALLRNGALPHALLFTGIAGLGKAAAAFALAQACNCTAADSPQEGAPPAEAGYPTQGCGQCRPCRKIEGGTHPDLIHIAPKGQMIRIEAIRGLLQTLAMKPYEARCRVVILTDAESLNPSAGNALLKILEEPPDRTILILTAQQRSDLLPTIVSRCQHLRFSPVSQERIQEALTAQGDTSPEDAAVLAPLAAGSMGRALALKKAGYIQRRNWLVQEMGALPGRLPGELLALAEVLAKDRASVDTDLDIMELYLRDLAVGAHCPDKIANMDLTDQIRYASQKISPEAVLKGMETIAMTRGRIRANANLRLTLEILVLRLSQALTI